MLFQNLYTLVVMKYLMKTLLPLLGTEKIEENSWTSNFSHDFQQQKKHIWIKEKGLKLTQNLYNLVVMKCLMKTPCSLARKTAFTVRNSKKSMKIG